MTIIELALCTRIQRNFAKYQDLICSMRLETIMGKLKYDLHKADCWNVKNKATIWFYLYEGSMLYASEPPGELSTHTHAHTHKHAEKIPPNTMIQIGEGDGGQ